MRIKKLGEGKIFATVVTKLWGGAAANKTSLLLKDFGYDIISPLREYTNYPNENDLRDYEEFLQSFVDRVLENV